MHGIDMVCIGSKLLLLIGFGLRATHTATKAKVQCSAPTPGAPWYITENCMDPVYDKPFVIDARDFDSSFAHHRVRARFNGTDGYFNIYLPPKSIWAGRFFQSAYPTQDENVDEETIAFGAESGAFTVQARGALGYRLDAAAAKFATKFAMRYYNYSRQIHGYYYGGSGGSYQVVGGIENTMGVWHGTVPMVQAVPVSIPLNDAVRGLAALTLRQKATLLTDAVRPAGRNPHEALDGNEARILSEATRQGIPLRAWEDFNYTANTFLLELFMSSVQSADPSYEDDFWSKPGYLGTESSELGDIMRAAKVELSATIQLVVKHAPNSSVSLTLNALPNIINRSGLEFSIYRANGSRVGRVGGTLNFSNNVFTVANDTDPEVVATFEEGLCLRIDNRWFLALHAYYRHQLPTRNGFYGFDQLRGRDGHPLYPQRHTQLAPGIAAGASGGGTHTGKINGKMIVVSNLLDVDAFPWHADWYKNQVQAALGDRFEDNYRLWFNDNADHNLGPVTGARATRLVEFTGVYQQALRDLISWVEQGKAPCNTSGYAVSDSQIVLADTATERQGVQPLVDLTANQQKMLHVSRGQAVQFNVSIETPPGAGEVASIEWDFLGRGDFEKRCVDTNSADFATAQFSYNSIGTYFPAVRVTTKRWLESPFGKIMNLGRARVVVLSE